MSDDPEAPASEAAPPRRKRRWLWGLLLVIAVVAIGAGGVWSWIRFDLGRPDHWTPGDTEWRAECGRDCVKIGPIGPAHGSKADDPLAVAVYDPKVNDRIAQWGDCLQSVAACAYSREGPPEAVIPPCVQASQCPAACKERFASETAGLEGKAMLEAYLEMFSGDDGYCTPRGA